MSHYNKYYIINNFRTKDLDMLKSLLLRRLCEETQSAVILNGLSLIYCM